MGLRPSHSQGWTGQPGEEPLTLKTSAVGSVPVLGMTLVLMFKSSAMEQESWKQVAAMASGVCIKGRSSSFYKKYIRRSWERAGQAGALHGPELERGFGNGRAVPRCLVHG